MATLKQSTAYTRTFLMVDSADHLSPKTGLTVGVWLSKAGAAFTAVSGSVSELSFGWYKVALNTTDTNTLGELAFHCTGSAADLTDFVDQVTGNILGDTLPANVTQWVGIAPNALISGTVDGFQHYPVTQNANVVQWNGTAPNNLISGTVDTFAHYSNILNANVSQWVGVVPNVLISGTVDAFSHYANTVSANVTQWQGSSPNSLISGTVDGYQHYPVTQDANIVSWRGATPNILISGTVDAFSHYANPIQAFLTGTVDVNLVQWRGTQPNVLVSGTVDAFEHYGNTISANLIQIDGQATNGNNATLYLKKLDIHASTSTALSVISDNGSGAAIQGFGTGGHGVYIAGNGSLARGIKIESAASNGVEVNGDGTAIQLTGNDIGIYINNLNSNNPAVYLDGAGRGLEIYGQTNDGVYIESELGSNKHGLVILGDGVGHSIYAPDGILSDITGSITGNIYGDIHGYVGWVTGSVQNVLVSSPSAPPTGTVNANVIQWQGDSPNNLISGTVDAFSHYSNPIQANVSITGTLDANVVTWRGNQPNNLVSGTVDSFTHYTNYPSSAITGSVDANVITWRGIQPNNLISGTVDAYVHYIDKTGYALTSTYDPAKTAAQAGDAMTLTAPYDAAKTASQAGDAMTLTAGERNSVADALLKRDWTAVTGEASRSVLNALRFIRNKFSTTAHANKVTIYKEDDTTEAYQKDVTTDATADPIVEG